LLGQCAQWTFSELKYRSPSIAGRKYTVFVYYAAFSVAPNAGLIPLRLHPARYVPHPAVARHPFGVKQALRIVMFLSFL
jgi:hypothetical protein